MTSKMKMGQAWGLDLMMASFLFIGGILVVYIYSLNLSDQTEETLSQLKYDGVSVADSLLSEGVPRDWRAGNVEKIGILSDGRINETKLELFYNLSIERYQKTKLLFGVNSNYYLIFSEPIAIGSNLVYGIGAAPVSPKNLIKITRIVIYKEKPINIDILQWD